VSERQYISSPAQNVMALIETVECNFSDLNRKTKRKKDYVGDLGIDGRIILDIDINPLHISR